MRRYPAYKPSGVEWLGEVPAGWEVSPLKRTCRFFTGWTPPTGNDLDYIGENLWANISDLGDREITDVAKRLSDDAIARYDIPKVPVGSLLFSFKLSIGAVSFAGAELYTNEAIATFPPQETIDLRFAYYAFPLMVVRNAAENIYGAKILNQELIRSATLALPPLPEQQAIAEFLDREVAKIDALVAEQRRLIELLAEKRQAVISHAVTKGLNPSAPLKPSCIDWLGDIPEGWEVVPLRAVCNFEQGKAHEPFIDDDGKYICVTARFVSSAGESYRRCTVNMTPARKGDILMVMSDLPGGRALARAFLVDRDDIYAVNQRVCRITVQRGDSRYFCYQLNRHQVLLSEDDGANQTHLSNASFTKLKLLVPSAGEQAKIADWLDRKIGDFDSLTSAATSAIALLQERRAALISAAVTGKIDVRPLSPATTEAA